MSLDKRLVALRKKLNLTQNELADKLNISRGALSLYELGNRRPDYETLIKLADFFNTSVEYLLGNTDDPRPLKEIIENPGSPLDKLLKEYNIDFYNLKEFNEEDMKDIIKYIQFVASKKKNND